MLYDYICYSCKQVEEVSKKLRDFDRREFCKTCSKEMYRRITAAAVAKDYAAYNCPVTGKRIEGKREHQKNLDKHNCRLQEPGEVEEFQKNKIKKDEQFLESAADKAVEIFQNMPAKLRDRVAGELVQGAEAPLVRV